MAKANIIIRMGAPYFDVRVRGADGQFVTFDHRTMSKEDKRAFHLTLLQQFRLNMPKRTL